jgi:hypothetical protein
VISISIVGVGRKILKLQRLRQDVVDAGETGGIVVLKDARA